MSCFVWPQSPSLASSSDQLRQARDKPNNNHKSAAAAEAAADQLPMLARVCKGTYGVVGERTPKESASGPGGLHTLLLYKRVKSVHVLCQSIKYSGECVRVMSSNKLSLPLTYAGWFEILSESGKSIRALGSVADLLHHATNKKRRATTYLVRENVKAYKHELNGTTTTTTTAAAAANEASSKHNLCDYKRVILKAGQRIRVLGACITKDGIKLVKCSAANASSTPTPTTTTTNGDEQQPQQQCVYLSEDTRAKFSPLAHLENISGVHRLADIIRKVYNIVI